MEDIRKEMRDRAGLIRGLVNALGYDADDVFTDVNNFDVICMEESFKEIKNTVGRLTQTVDDLERLLYLIKRRTF